MTPEQRKYFDEFGKVIPIICETLYAAHERETWCVLVKQFEECWIRLKTRCGYYDESKS